MLTEMSTPSAQPERAVVLVVDDERALLLMMERTLRDLCDVRAFPDPQQAFEQALKLKPALILTDYRMPGMTGVDLLRKLRAAGVPFDALLLTGYADLDDVVRAKEEQLITRVVPKPWRPVELRAQVEQALERWRSSRLDQKLE